MRDRAIMLFASGQQIARRRPLASAGAASCCALRANGQQSASAPPFRPLRSGALSRVESIIRLSMDHPFSASSRNRSSQRHTAPRAQSDDRSFSEDHTQIGNRTGDGRFSCPHENIAGISGRKWFLRQVMPSVEWTHVLRRGNDACSSTRLPWRFPARIARVLIDMSYNL